MSKTEYFLGFIIFLLLNTLSIYGQESTYQKISLTNEDLAKAMLIKELRLTESYKNANLADLPWKINNADLPFFRPIFNQEGASCGQASGVGYNFTYEINCARGVDALLPENQYPTHFAYNWMNGGYGWRGVSYFHSFDLLKKNGSPSVSSYGGMYEGGPSRWMSGFDKYYSAMLNRIKEVYAINVTTPEGLLTLKHWLFDHLGESEYGGVASFYTGLLNMRTLATGTPEEGKHVYIEWWPEATHALTIVGFNDSIRFDINQDGFYTNDIDINDDGVVDMKDWEIGALLFANSYGNNWADSGYCYMMYRSLALDYGQGGIWNGEVHVLKVEDTYDPLLTMKVKLNYNSRENLKLVVGVNSENTDNYPIHTMEFPILNFQGSSQPLQGLPISDTLDPYIMELELDVSELLSYVENGDNARYFIQIIENDPVNSGEGEILYFSLIDRTGNINEIVFDELPSAIINNSITCLSIVSTISFDRPHIITNELPAFVSGENYNVDLQASGGEIPYNWSLRKDYSVNTIQKEFPETSGEELSFDDMEVGHTILDLQFPFPYYGDTLNQISVALDGFVSFGDDDLSYPYYFGETSMIYDHKIIAPFMTDLWLAYNDYSDDDGVWVENTPEYFTVVWKTSYRYFGVIYDSDFSFALRLYPDGKIETYYDNFEIPSYIMWVSGVSNGDKNNYTLNPFIQNQNNPKGSAFSFQMSEQADGIEISPQGLLSVNYLDDNTIYQITAQVNDSRNISERKTFQLSSGLTFDYVISAGTDSKIDFADTVSVKLLVKNGSSQNFNNINCECVIEDGNFNMLKSQSLMGDFAAGETKIFDSAFVFTVDKTISDNYKFFVETNLFNSTKNWNSEIIMTANAIHLDINSIHVSNENNGFLDPGESATLNIVLNNQGHTDGIDLDFKLVSSSDYLKVNTSNQHLELIAIGEERILDFDVKTIPWTPSGITIPCEIQMYFHGELLNSLAVDITIGLVPVLLLNLEEQTASAEKFTHIFDTLSLIYEYSSYLPEELGDYKSIFICLGQMFNSHELTYYEAFHLDEYLVNGGNIYMEGMNVWNDNEQLMLHEKFNINSVSNTQYFEIDNVYGVASGFTGGIKMDYGGSMNFNNHYLEPRGAAFPILRTSLLDTACAIANSTPTYKTVGSSLIFGAMENEDDPSVTIDYVKSILDFFEIEIQYASIDENDLIKTNPSFKLFPNPFKSQLSIIFYGTDDKDASFQIFDISGRLIKYQDLPNLLANEEFEFVWDSKDENGKLQPAGIYIVKYIAGKNSSTAKVILR